MKKKRLKNLTSRFYKTLEECSREVALDFNEEAVHDFRVAYKKMRAFFRLVNARYGKRMMKVPKQLKEIYSLAGMFRDRQLQLTRLCEAAPAGPLSFQEYHEALAWEMSEIRSQLLQLLTATSLHDTPKPAVEQLGSNFKLEDFSSYMRQSCTSAREILALTPLPDERLHKIRKILKDLFYNLEIYSQEGKFPLGTWKEKVAGYFNPLLRELGEYQDKCTAIELLESYWLQHLDNTEIAQIADVKDEWNRDKTTMKLRLVTQLTADRVITTGDLREIPLIVHTGL
jgi:CHAD domain-containing protein